MGANIHAKVRAEFMPKDINPFLKRHRQVIVDWCEQVPFLGFNCRHYDLNLIKEHFTELIADTTGKVQVWKKVKERLFIRTNGFCFVYILLYLTPGTSYDKWAKAYGCSVLKSWLPYKLFDNPERLCYLGLPDYPMWYSDQRGTNGSST